MKKLILSSLMLTFVLLTSCGSGEEEAGKSLTFEEKVEKVCDCFTSAKEKGDAPAPCFQMQGEMGNKFKDDKEKVKFNQATNKCAR